MSRISTWIKVCLSLALGVGLCAALVMHLSISSGDALKLINELSCGSILIVAALSWGMAATGARKWKIWSSALYGGKKEAPNHLRHILWQTWIGQFVPPSLAIILGRGFADKSSGSFKNGAVSGVYDQALEFLFLAAMLPAGVSLIWGQSGVGAFIGYAALGLVMTGALIISVARSVRPEWLAYLWPLMGWSLLRVLLTVVRLAVGAPALGLSIDLWLIIAASPVVALLALIPLTPGNLGIAEWGWVGVLSIGGVDPFKAGLLAVGFRVLILVIQSVLLVAYEGALYVRQFARV